MMNNLRTVTCPTCKGARGWCEECYGSGIITLEQQTVPYKRARLWQVALLCFVAALAIIAAFHWWLDGALKSIGL